MKIILIMVAAAFLSTGSMAIAIEDQSDPAVSSAKKKKPKKPKPVPCACVCAGTLGGTKWSCSPTACSTKDGTYCSAGGPSQSPIGIDAETPGR